MTCLKQRRMKRLGELYYRICSFENLVLADMKARKGKTHRSEISTHDSNQVKNLARLHLKLVFRTYKTSPYEIFTVREKKEREVYKLPYYPDRITHHAIMNVLEPVFVKNFTTDTYSCIKGKGIHGAFKKFRNDLQDRSGTTYCLKLDITKFYPSVNHDILKKQLRRKFKDQDLLWLLDEIIDSAPGLPIGNLLSQFLANFYLSPFDHWLKEVKRVKYYYRYADDLVFLSGNKEYLHKLQEEISWYLENNLELQLKDNWQVFPVDKRGVDFIGYVFRHDYIRIRKSIKQSFARAIARGAGLQSINSYLGWAKHADANHLIKKLLTQNA